jgi:hypothetical protein
MLESYTPHPQDMQVIAEILMDTHLGCWECTRGGMHKGWNNCADMLTVLLYIIPINHHVYQSMELEASVLLCGWPWMKRHGSRKSREHHRIINQAVSQGLTRVQTTVTLGALSPRRGVTWHKGIPKWYHKKNFPSWLSACTSMTATATT